MLKLLFSFAGRVNRGKYWLVTLGIIVVIAVVFGVALPADFMTADSTTTAQNIDATDWIALLVIIPLVWIALANIVKRWHDRDKSGWWILINFVPFIGGLWQFIECGFLPGTVGSNRFGPDPRL